MSETRASARTSAAIHGPRWGARAGAWAELCAGSSLPAWEAVAATTGIGGGTTLLDVGCGSGEFCQLAATRGASVSGIDAAEGMVEIARRQVPGGDFRVGAMESLPWADNSFDVVTGFNAFQFAADVVGALAEARRVALPTGRVAICAWGRFEDNELLAILGPLRELRPPPSPGAPPPGIPALGEPGALEDVARKAGLDPLRAGEVDVPFEAADQDTLERALLASGGVVPAIEHSGEEAVRNTIGNASAPFRRPDGSYLLKNRFRYLISAPARSPALHPRERC
jgi:SAM-dependent methyltransferase